MSMNIKDVKSTGNGQKLFSNLEVGPSYPARVVQVIGLGMHEKIYQGGSKGYHPRMWITYELDEPMLDDKGNAVADKPSWLSEDLWLSPLNSDKAKSTLRLNAIDAGLKQTGGDLLKLIDLPCMVTVAEYKKKDGSIGQKVGDVNAPAKRMVFADLVNAPVVFDPYNPDMEIFNKLPKFLQETITSSVDWGGKEVPQKEEEKTTTEEDEVPY